MSKSLRLRPGATVCHGGRPYVITHVLDLGAVIAKAETGESERLAIKDLTAVPAPAGGDDEVPARELTGIDQVAWQEVERRLAIIRPLISAARRTKAMVKEAARDNGLSAATLYRWINRYERSGLISSLLPQPRPGGKDKSRMRPEVEQIMLAAIEDYYLSTQKRTVKKTHDEVRARCRRSQLKPPHMLTVRNRIKAIPAAEKERLRAGANSAAAVKHEAFPGHFPGADWPLAVAQIDHTLLDIELVDDVHRRPVGRPWLTIAIEVFSRMVLGYYVSLDPPGASSVGLCIANAVLPKDTWLARHDIQLPWPCWGLMAKIHADNAAEFRGLTLKRACQQYGIELEWRPVKKPHYGAHIERLLGTLAAEIHALPGTTFSNPKERGEYDSEKHAAMTLAEFDKWLVTYILGVYHQRRHGALRTSPIKQYERGIFGDEERPGRGLPDRLVDEERLRLDFMPCVERTVQRYGVVIDEIHYFGDALRRYVNAADPGRPKIKRKFIFKRDPRDVSAVFFFDPEVEQYFAIPYRDIARPPMSLWELRAARRRLDERGVAEVNEGLIFDTYEQMRTQEEKAVRATKRARRENQRRETHRQVRRPPATTTAAVDSALSSQDSAGKVIAAFDDLEELS